MIERLTPKDRRAWLAMRGRDVTASVVGALFGEHDFITEYELWAAKTGRIKATSEESEAMRRGRLLEPVAVQILREMQPTWHIEYSTAEQVYFRDPAARLGGTPDVIVDAPERGRGIVQVKTVAAPVYRKKWLVDGEPEAPLWIAMQASVEAYLTGSRWAAVAPLVIDHYGLDMPLIEVPIVDGLIDAIKDRVAEFWAMVESGREPEPDYARDAALIERLYAEGDDFEEVDLSDDNRIPVLLAEREELVEDLKAAKDRLSEIEAEVKAKMGHATVAHLGDGRRITWETRHRRGFTSPPSSYRFLKFPKPLT
jgi:predicted phage-related endonuclease